MGVFVPEDVEDILSLEQNSSLLFPEHLQFHLRPDKHEHCSYSQRPEGIVHLLPTTKYPLAENNIDSSSALLPSAQVQMYTSTESVRNFCLNGTEQSPGGDLSDGMPYQEIVNDRADPLWNNGSQNALVTPNANLSKSSVPEVEQELDDDDLLLYQMQSLNANTSCASVPFSKRPCDTVFSKPLSNPSQCPQDAYTSPTKTNTYNSPSTCIGGPHISNETCELPDPPNTHRNGMGEEHGNKHGATSFTGRHHDKERLLVSKGGPPRGNGEDIVTELPLDCQMETLDSLNSETKPMVPSSGQEQRYNIHRFDSLPNHDQTVSSEASAVNSRNIVRHEETYKRQICEEQSHNISNEEVQKIYDSGKVQDEGAVASADDKFIPIPECQFLKYYPSQLDLQPEHNRNPNPETSAKHSPNIDEGSENIERQISDTIREECRGDEDLEKVQIAKHNQRRKTDAINNSIHRLGSRAKKAGKSKRNVQYNIQINQSLTQNILPNDRHNTPLKRNDSKSELYKLLKPALKDGQIRDLQQHLIREMGYKFPKEDIHNDIVQSLAEALIASKDPRRILDILRSVELRLEDMEKVETLVLQLLLKKNYTSVVDLVEPDDLKAYLFPSQEKIINDDQKDYDFKGTWPRKSRQMSISLENN